MYRGVLYIAINHYNGEDTCHSEDPELALSPDFVLMQQKWQQHEQSSIMYHPPDVYVSLHAV